MTKIAVTGAKGMLGTDFVAVAKNLGHELLEFDLPEFDLRNKDHIRNAVGSADVVINLAAYTNVDGAESESKLCFDVNAEAVGSLARECAVKNRYLLHVSTDFVFGDDTSLPLSETDQTNPLNTYGRSKLEGERLILNSGADAAILRLQWTYGMAGNNFVSKILAKAKVSEELRIVHDQVGTPTWTVDASKAILSLAGASARGIFHFAPIGYVSRFEFAKFALGEAGINVPVIPCSSSELRSPARRPLNSRFDCSKIDSFLGMRRPEWRKSISEFILLMKKRGMI